MKKQIDSHYDKEYCKNSLGKESEYLMPAHEVIDVARKYFVDFFGKEYEDVIVERLLKTDFGFVNKDNFSRITQRFIDNCNNFPFHKDNDATLPEDIVNSVYKEIERVSSFDGTGGRCFFFSCRDAEKKGAFVDMRRGVFVGDYKDTAFEYTSTDTFFDVNVCHELIHAVTQHVKNNYRQSGIDGFDDKSEMTEWVVDNMALEITKKLYEDGITFSKYREPQTDILCTHRAVTKKLKAIPDGFFNKYKGILKPAMLTGDYKELHDAFGGEKGLEEVAKGFEGYESFCRR